MATAKEFAKSGITGQTFKEITDKFGQNFNALAESDKTMANFALAFAWFRDREHLPVPEAYAKALGLTTSQVVALFEDHEKPGVEAAADFVSPPPTTTP